MKSKITDPDSEIGKVPYGRNGCSNIPHPLNVY